MQPVLTVGLDGSPESLAAARWAADEAAKRGSPCVCCTPGHCWRRNRPTSPRKSIRTTGRSVSSTPRELSSKHATPA